MKFRKLIAIFLIAVKIGTPIAIPVVLSGCGNLIQEVVEEITSGSGSCPAEDWGGHCDN
jgi:hypothetical protein